MQGKTMKTRVCFIGVGGMARAHLRQMLKQQDTTEVVGVCEPSPLNYELTAQLFQAEGLEPPPNYTDLDRVLEGAGKSIDAVFIITPHIYHHDQAKLCMEAGLDVLLEKPMVMNAAEARSLIETRNQTGRLLVVAFQGSLSPQIRAASAMLRSGELGKILNISGTVWQDWGALTVGTWRQREELSGGGFLFDTGAHMLNTVSDLAGEDFDEVAAWLDMTGRPVETRGVVMGRLKSGALVTINGCGEAIPSCESEIRVFCEKAIVRTGQWGERLEIQRYGRKRLRPVPVTPSLGVWEQFLKTRRGEMQNPCPPEIGLRMAYLYDAVKASAACGGQPVKCDILRRDALPG
jgi:predicted dehydrogenase